MKITVKKTDRRHTGSDRFKYYVEIKATKHGEWALAKEKFFEMRQWCWETWGPSREVDQYTSFDESYKEDQSHAWAWINDQHRYRLYLGNKEEAAHFTLRWS